MYRQEDHEWLLYVDLKLARAKKTQQQQQIGDSADSINWLFWEKLVNSHLFKTLIIFHIEGGRHWPRISTRLFTNASAPYNRVCCVSIVSPFQIKTRTARTIIGTKSCVSKSHCCWQKGNVKRGGGEFSLFYIIISRQFCFFRIQDIE